MLRRPECDNKPATTPTHETTSNQNRCDVSHAHEQSRASLTLLIAVATRAESSRADTRSCQRAPLCSSNTFSAVLPPGAQGGTAWALPMSRRHSCWEPADTLVGHPRAATSESCLTPRRPRGGSTARRVKGETEHSNVEIPKNSNMTIPPRRTGRGLILVHACEEGKSACVHACVPPQTCRANPQPFHVPHANREPKHCRPQRGRQTT